jgi:hypothetical protein
MFAANLRHFLRPYHLGDQGSRRRVCPYSNQGRERHQREKYIHRGELEARIEAFVAHYNRLRYYENIDKLTPPTSTSSAVKLSCSPFGEPRHLLWSGSFRRSSVRVDGRNSIKLAEMKSM